MIKIVFKYIFLNRINYYYYLLLYIQKILYLFFFYKIFSLLNILILIKYI